ncbi:variable large family protein (plasmid) [Borrelia turicatae 91E135]|nr:variable large family protein [Borrelia turicatae 91E135]
MKTEDPKTTFLTSIANLGKGSLDVFTSLSDMVAGAFGIKAETKKSDVGKYFASIETTMNTVKKKLQTEVAANGNYSKIKTIVEHFITNTLDKIAEGATTDSAIGGATKDGQDPAPADVASINSLIKGIKIIVDVVLKKDEGSAEATKTEEKAANAINGVAASAVNKTLSTLIIAIRNTVDIGLKTINAVLDTVTQGR